MSNPSTHARTRPFGRVGMALAAAAVVVGTVVAGQSTANASLTYYELRAQHSDKCADVSGFSFDNGAPLIQWDCWGGRNQYFRLNYMNNGYHEIRALHTDKCLDVAGGSWSNGAQIIQWDCWGGWNQQFKLNYVGNGFYELRAHHTDKCVDVYNGSGATGAGLIQWDCWGGANQRFRLA